MIKPGKLYRTSLPLWGDNGIKEFPGVRIPRGSIILFIDALPDAEDVVGGAQCKILFEDRIQILFGHYDKWFKPVTD